jgi:hypothetical protein
MTDPCEHGNEPSDCIRDGLFLDRLDDHQFLKKTLLHGVFH